MAREEQDSQRKREKKGFLSGQKIVYLVVFVLGFAFGIVLTNQFIDPALNIGLIAEKSFLEEKNRSLDKQVDQCFACLEKTGIGLESCVQGT